MNDIKKLPSKKGKITQEEREVMDEYFSKKVGEGSPEGKKMDWQLIGYTILIFILIANPWVDSLLGCIPQCPTNKPTIFGIKIVIFAILMTIMIWVLKKRES